MCSVLGPSFVSRAATCLTAVHSPSLGRAVEADDYVHRGLGDGPGFGWVTVITAWWAMWSASTSALGTLWVPVQAAASFCEKSWVLALRRSCFGTWSAPSAGRSVPQIPTRSWPGKREPCPALRTPCGARFESWPRSAVQALPVPYRAAVVPMRCAGLC